jgi:3-oxoacyl-[acyl-carrier-protein] synthase III
VVAESSRDGVEIHAAITGVNCYVLPDVLDNAALARMVDTTDEWITARTSIAKPHVPKAPGLGTSHMAALRPES